MRNHRHVEARVNGTADGIFRGHVGDFSGEVIACSAWRRGMFDAFPVSNHVAVKSEFRLENFGEQDGINVLMNSVHLVKACHDAQGALLDGGFVWWQVFFVEILFRDDGVATVVSFLGGSVTDKVLDGGNYTPIGVVVIALLTADECGSEANSKFGIFTKTFVDAAPAFVLRYGDGRCEVQVDVGCPHFFGDGLSDFAYERRVARCSEADVVREDGRPFYIRDAVYVIFTIGDGNLLTPGVHMKVCIVGTTAFESGTANAFAAFEHRNFRLRHLGNHVVHRHASHNLIDFIFDGVALQGDIVVFLLACDDAERFGEEPCLANDDALILLGIAEFESALVVGEGSDVCEQVRECPDGDSGVVNGCARFIDDVARNTCLNDGYSCKCGECKNSDFYAIHSYTFITR